MQSHMLSLVTLDFVLRIIGARMVSVAFVGHIFGVHFDNPAAEVTRFSSSMLRDRRLRTLGHGPAFEPGLQVGTILPSANVCFAQTDRLAFHAGIPSQHETGKRI
jgi:hypothetical protein